MRLQENPYVFYEKRPYTEPLQRPNSDHGVARELALYSIAFQWSSYGDSQRSDKFKL